MEKAKTIRRVKNVLVCEFYCDICGEKIGESEEYSDGYIAELGEFEYSVNVNGWYKIKKCLCDNCKEIYTNKIICALKELGFEKDED